MANMHTKFELTNFDDSDWQTFMGCEVGPNLEVPQIGTYTFTNHEGLQVEQTLVVDGRGLALMIYTHFANGDVGYREFSRDLDYYTALGFGLIMPTGAILSDILLEMMDFRVIHEELFEREF